MDKVYRVTQDTTRGNSARVIKAGTLVTVLAHRAEDGRALVRLHPRKKTTWANMFSMSFDLLQEVHDLENCTASKSPCPNCV